MFTALLQIKNYKLFVVNMLLLGMGIAVTVPYLVLFATKDLGMTTTQYGLLLALAAISQLQLIQSLQDFQIHITSIERYSLYLLYSWAQLAFQFILRTSNMVIYCLICNFSRFICSRYATTICLSKRIN